MSEDSSKESSSWRSQTTGHPLPKGDAEREGRDAYLEDLGVCSPGPKPVRRDDAALEGTVGASSTRSVLTL